MVSTREVDRRISEDIVPHTKEFAHDSVHKEKLLQVLKSGRVWDKEF